MKIAVRQRYPEPIKELKIIRTYDSYAHYEIENNDINHAKSGVLGLTQRILDLQRESAKTLEALREKQPVRIPEIKAKEQLTNIKDNSKHY